MARRGIVYLHLGVLGAETPAAHLDAHRARFSRFEEHHLSSSIGNIVAFVGECDAFADIGSDEPTPCYMFITSDGWPDLTAAGRAARVPGPDLRPDVRAMLWEDACDQTWCVCLGPRDGEHVVVLHGWTEDTKDLTEQALTAAAGRLCAAGWHPWMTVADAQRLLARSA